MKKLLLLAVVTFLFGAPAFAQVSIFDIKPESEEQCTKITQAMALQLHLNETEYIKLKELNRNRLVITEALIQTAKDNPAMLADKMKKIEVAYEQELNSFLTPKQQLAYANYKQDNPQVKFVANKDN